MAPKLRAHVTEGIPSTHARFCSYQLKITHGNQHPVPNDKQRSVIRSLILENVSGNEIHMRMFVV